MTTSIATTFDAEQALAGLTARAVNYGWKTIVLPEEHFNLIFVRDLADGRRELIHTRFSSVTGRITQAERQLGTDTELAEREVFRTDKRLSVQLAMSKEPEAQ